MGGLGKQYGWPKVLETNKAIREACTQHNGCILHDLEGAWGMRPDAHMHWNPASNKTDCGHWCTVGGPMDLGSTVLHEALPPRHTRRGSSYSGTDLIKFLRTNIQVDQEQVLAARAPTKATLKSFVRAPTKGPGHQQKNK